MLKSHAYFKKRECEKKKSISKAATEWPSNLMGCGFARQMSCIYSKKPCVPIHEYVKKKK